MVFDEEIKARHSVRQYTTTKIDGEVLSKLNAEIDRVNAESGLKIRLVMDEPTAFSGFMTRMTKFRNAVNYLAVIGKDDPSLNFKAGYYGEQLVLFAQSIGLNTCWAMFCGKKACNSAINEGDKMVIGIAIGYGENQGVQHKNRPVSDVADLNNAPEWFAKGVEYAMDAPTGMNRQAFKFSRKGDEVTLSGGKSTLSQIDLGIVRYHFECGAGKENFKWSWQ